FEFTTPIDLAFSESVRDEFDRRCVGAPQLLRQAFHLLVATPVVVEAGRFHGRCSYDRGSIAGQLLDLSQEFRGHGVHLRENQQAVAHAAREHEPAVLHTHLFKNYFGWAGVETVAWPVVTLFDRGFETLRGVLGREETQ